MKSQKDYLGIGSVVDDVGFKGSIVAKGYTHINSFLTPLKSIRNWERRLGAYFFDVSQLDGLETHDKVQKDLRSG